MTAEQYPGGRHERTPPPTHWCEMCRHSPWFTLSSTLSKTTVEIPKNFRKTTLTKWRVSMTLKATSQCLMVPASLYLCNWLLHCPLSPGHVSRRLLWEHEPLPFPKPPDILPSLETHLSNPAWSPQQAGLPLAFKSMVLFSWFIIRVFHLTIILGPFIET